MTDLNKTRKRICVILIAILLCFSMIFAVACSRKNNNNPQTDSDVNSLYFSFFDDAETEIKLTEKPRRVAVLFSSYAEIWTSVGGEIAVTVGESVERGFAPEGAVLVDKGAGKSINKELLLSSAPDFIIASKDITAQAEIADFFNGKNIPFALFRVEDFSDYKRVMKILSGITANGAAYALNVENQETEIQNIVQGIPKSENKPKILFIRCGSSASSTKVKNAADNFVCRMLEELGTVNVADEAQYFTEELSAEAILQSNPDFIFFSTMGNEAAAKNYMNGELGKSPWRHLDAIQNGRYFFLPKNLFQFKPNSRWSEAYAYLYDILYGNKEQNGHE